MTKQRKFEIDGGSILVRSVPGGWIAVASWDRGGFVGAQMLTALRAFIYARQEMSRRRAAHNATR